MQTKVTIFSREIEVSQNTVNKSDIFFREMQMCQIKVNKSDNFSLVYFSKFEKSNSGNADVLLNFVVL